MSKEKGVLGRGLAAILGNNTTDIIDASKNKKKNESSVNLANTHEIFISQIVTNPFQPRMEFNHERLNELAISIERKPGLMTTKEPINPIITAAHLLKPTFSPNKTGEKAVTIKGAIKANVKALAKEIIDIA